MVTQALSQRNEAPSPPKKQNVHAFILVWTKKGKCGKVTKIYEEAKGREGLF